MTVLNVTLAGAPGSGKSRLAAALTQALNKAGWPAAVGLADPATQDNNALILLMGLESQAEDIHAADQTIRAALTRAGTVYDVLYGSMEERLAQALGLIEKRLTGADPRSPTKNNRPWIWVCDKCSDPQCEHRLLTDLLAKRLITAP
ncbi:MULTISPECIES: hypothetical protein [Polaromonas]|uniref:Uncharacterized protein n=1 Tax=Polaromonas aquatica TaxID=332657 RepID=A0ABW1TTV5_9BURK